MKKTVAITKDKQGLCVSVGEIKNLDELSILELKGQVNKHNRDLEKEKLALEKRVEALEEQIKQLLQDVALLKGE